MHPRPGRASRVESRRREIRRDLDEPNENTDTAEKDLASLLATGSPPTDPDCPQGKIQVLTAVRA